MRQHQSRLMSLLAWSVGWSLGRGDEGHGGRAAKPGDRVCVAHRIGREVG